MNKKGVEPSESHKHNYVAALKIAMQFFDIQKSGKLVNNQIKWRGDSGLKDGKEVDLDLSKGMYDAGDAVKFGFPLAFTATMLSWTILERGQRMGMEGVDQLQKAKDSVKWITDYLVNAHPKDNVLYVQVGDAEKDHKCWQRPESITDNKPLFQINTTAPGSDVAAETAAALASASLVFKKSDPPYSAKLLEHAKKLFIFADKYREYYSVSLPQVKKYYNSTGYGDELLWAASWLYHATQEDIYKDYVVGSEAEEFADWGKPSWFSWDNKLAGVQVLLSRVYFFHGKDNTKLAKYRKSAQALMCTLLPESPSATSDRTNGGLIWIAEWNALQHPVAVAFLASLYGDYMEKSDNENLECDEKTFKSEDLREFAKKQADYVLGDNPNSMSYLVGYSKKFPKFVHHRGASIPADATTGCKDGYQWLESTKPNPNEATGALVGGPFMNETYIDSRNNSMQGEPTTYNSALLVGLLSSLATSSQSVVTSLG
ncbi:Endoglucanase 2 [Citrus sinensis]|uniref:Endoglucanase 2 n=1 Tax=Citrus sinensis TaxID=2711 RepID=A0ACB8KX60_CITSI|nr:Endoglucanase 2 [Citrus sinensis]